MICRLVRTFSFKMRPPKISNFYEILEVKNTASFAEIENAFIARISEKQNIAHYENSSEEIEIINSRSVCSIGNI